jgi:hypothetical protein
MTDIIQRSFSGGELSPTLNARADITKYVTGLKTCRNFIIHKHGGASNRSGTSYVKEVKSSVKRAILVPFRYSNSQTYVMEFGDKYIRLHRLRGTIMVTDTDAPVWDAATAFVIGDLTTHSGIRYYCKQGNTNVVPPNATYWYAMPGDIFEIPTPYLEADLSMLRFAQSLDVVSIVHDLYAPMDLRRYGNVKWAMEAEVFGPPVFTISGTATPGAVGTTVYRYKVAALDADTNEESEVSAVIECTGATPTLALPNVLKWSCTPAPSSFRVFKEFIPGNGVFGICGITVPHTDAPAWSAATTYVVGDMVTSVSIRYYCILGHINQIPPNATYWVVVPADTASGTFNDPNIVPAYDQPITNKPKFNAVSEYPAEIAYYQGRRLYAATITDPELVVATRTDEYLNLCTSTPLKDNDSVSFSLAGGQMNRVVGLVALRKLILLTESGEWSIEGDVSGVLTPGNINPVQQSYNGSARISPIVIGNEILYVQARGAAIRNLGYEFQSDGYKGDDVTLFADHLFKGKTVVSWAYSQIPNSVVWVVLDDGSMLGLTYLKSQQVWGWHRHDTGGDKVESVCVIPEENEDVLYMVVNRTINSATKRYVEVMRSRLILDVINDSNFVDCGMEYDGTNLDPLHTMSLTGTSWNSDDLLNLWSNKVFFDTPDVGNQIVLTVDGVTIRVTIVSVTHPTASVVRAVQNVPAAFQSTAINEWSKAVDELSGLDHLEGRIVAVLGDGFVVSNGYDNPVVVSGGTVVLGKPYTVIKVGIPIESDFETLNIDLPEQTTISNKESLVNRVDLMVESSRGIWVGPDADHLTEYKQREYEGYYDAIALKTGIVSIGNDSTYDKGGRIFVRQRDPLPLTILSAIPVGNIGSKE